MSNAFLGWLSFTLCMLCLFVSTVALRGLPQYWMLLLGNVWLVLAVKFAYRAWIEAREPPMPKE